MLNIGLKALIAADIVRNREAAEQILLEVLGSLGKIVDLKSAIPHFFDFFKSLSIQGETEDASRYLEGLLKTRYKKQLNPLMPFRFLFQYLEKKDDSIIRRQPPELQKILNKLIEEIEQKQQ